MSHRPSDPLSGALFDPDPPAHPQRRSSSGLELFPAPSIPAATTPLTPSLGAPPVSSLQQQLQQQPAAPPSTQITLSTYADKFLSTMPPSPLNDSVTVSNSDLPGAIPILSNLLSMGQTTTVQALTHRLIISTSIFTPPLSPLPPVLPPLLYLHTLTSLTLNNHASLDQLTSLLSAPHGPLPPYLHILLLAAHATSRPSRALDLLHNYTPPATDELGAVSEIGVVSNIFRLTLLSNIYSTQKEHRLALATLDEIMSCLSKHAGVLGGLAVGGRVEEAMGEVRGRMVRIFLQLGDEKGAGEVVKGWEGGGVNRGIHESLLTFARHDYAATIPQLLSLLASCQSAPPPSPALDPFSQLSSHCGLVPTEPYATIATNLSLSYLYTCQLPAAIKTLEDAFVRAPAFVTNAMVFNLCTLYDLAFDNAVSGRKKRVMEEVVKRWGLEVKKESFRI